MPPRDALRHCIVEIENHVALDGWDGPVRLFALVRTARALAEHPELKTQLPAAVLDAARQDSDHLTAIEQHGFAGGQGLEDIVAHLAWPPSVDGCALSVERMVVDAAAQLAMPTDPHEAIEFLASHPSRQDVRIVAGVLRDGTRYAAMRSRAVDAPDAVPTGEDLAPGLCDALLETLSAPE